MKHLVIIAFAALWLTACTTREKETHTETVVHEEPAQAPPASPPVVIRDPTPAPVVKEEKQNKVEVTLSDTGSGIKVRIP